MGQLAAKQNQASGSCSGPVGLYGFVAKLFRSQDKRLRMAEATERLMEAIVVSQGSLSRNQKEGLLECVACARGNVYLQDFFAAVPSTVPAAGDSALLNFAVKLARYGPYIRSSDVAGLRRPGFDDAAIVEGVATVALGQLLCTLADGLCQSTDSGRQSPNSSALPDNSPPLNRTEPPGPYLAQTALSGDIPVYGVLRQQLGFIPNIFKLQSSIPILVEAEVRVIESILFAEDHLSRVQKENILLVLSAANLNTYFVAVHSQVLDALGIPIEQSDQLVEDYRQVGLPATEVSLLQELRKLAIMRPPSASGREEVGNASAEGFNAGRLRQIGFTEAQLLEAVATAALTNFLNTLQFGLGAVPDFPPRRVFSPKDLYRFSDEVRPTSHNASSVDLDPDADLVVRVQQGETDAFEELVRRHTRRVFGTLGGILGEMDETRDATQEVFLKAFEHLAGFQGRSKFSTWLTSIAINTGTEILRKRRPSEPLEEEDDVNFRPLQVQSWAENPEQLFATSQMDALVRQAVLSLPQKYRVAVLLRDINQLSTEDAAAALQLSIPALKARVLRGRLMLRERLAPHFIRSRGTDA
jgi:RNA polymerase sigma-70 factor (ECF subfamily)